MSSYVVASLSATEPGEVRVTAHVDELPDRPYFVEVRTPDGLTSTLYLSAAAAEALVDGLIEALTAGGDRHDPAPF